MLPQENFFNSTTSETVSGTWLGKSLSVTSTGSPPFKLLDGGCVFSRV